MDALKEVVALLNDATPLAFWGFVIHELIGLLKVVAVVGVFGYAVHTAGSIIGKALEEW